MRWMFHLSLQCSFQVVQNNPYALIGYLDYMSVSTPMLSPLFTTFQLITTKQLWNCHEMTSTLPFVRYLLSSSYFWVGHYHFYICVVAAFSSTIISRYINHLIFSKVLWVFVHPDGFLYLTVVLVSLVSCLLMFNHTLGEISAATLLVLVCVWYCNWGRNYRRFKII